MSFLTPWLLLALPIAALPILIHLINQRRFQNVEWGAIRFLLEANRMSRGYARIRQWLILLFRTLAVAALVFVVARPLASGLLGLTGGGRAETTLILIDRSPSMGQVGAGTATSKLETGLSQLVRTLELVGSTRWVVIDSTTATPREISEPAALETLIPGKPTAASADLPALLDAARNYIAENRTGQTEIWICSDLRANDWQATSGRWRTLRDSFLEFKQAVRFHLLAYPDLPNNNLTVTVTGVRQQTSAEGNGILVSLRVARQSKGGVMTVPVSFELAGARSELTVELTEDAVEVVDHPLTLAAGHERGWGRVSIPADSNPADNDYYFVFDKPLPRRVAIVSTDPTPLRAMEIAAVVSPTPNLKQVVDSLTPEQLASVPWDEVALVVWHAPLPDGSAAAMLDAFVARGGQVLCVPSSSPGGAEWQGAKWGAWVDHPKPISPESWWGDEGLLSRSQSGAALPVGNLAIHRHCELTGEVTPLATLPGGNLLVARSTRDKGGVYFLATTPAPSDSSLAADGVVLYVALQRAIATGSESLGNTRQMIAGQPNLDTTWQPLATSDEALSSEYAWQGGVYASDERLMAINRGGAEALAPVLTAEQVDGLFAGLDFDRVTDQAGNLNSLTREIWRVFLVGMIAALVVEAGLCLPKPRAVEARA